MKISQSILDRIRDFERRYLCKLLGIKYYNECTKESVVQEVKNVIGPFTCLDSTVKRIKLKWFGHVASHGATHHDSYLLTSRHYICCFAHCEVCGLLVLVGLPESPFPVFPLFSSNIGTTLRTQCLLVTQVVVVSELFSKQKNHYAPHYSTPEHVSFSGGMNRLKTKFHNLLGLPVQAVIFRLSNNIFPEWRTKAGRCINRCRIVNVSRIVSPIHAALKKTLKKTLARAT